MLRRPAVLALVLTTPAVAAPPTPAALAPCVKDGRFDPGDFGWARGYFSDATAAQKIEGQATQAWIKICMEQATAARRRELAVRRRGTRTTCCVFERSGLLIGFTGQEAVMARLVWLSDEAWAKLDHTCRTGSLASRGLMTGGCCRASCTF